METILLDGKDPGDIQRAGEILRQGGPGGHPYRDGVRPGGQRPGRRRGAEDLQGQGPPLRQPADRTHQQPRPAAPLGGSGDRARPKAGPSLLARAPDHDPAQVPPHPSGDQRGPFHGGGALPRPPGGPGGDRRGGGSPGGPLGQPLRQAQPHHLPPCAGGPHRPGGRPLGRGRLRRGGGVHGGDPGRRRPPAAAARGRHPRPAPGRAGRGGSGPGGPPPAGGGPAGRLPRHEVQALRPGGGGGPGGRLPRGVRGLCKRAGRRLGPLLWGERPPAEGPLSGLRRPLRRSLPGPQALRGPAPAGPGGGKKGLRPNAL